MSSGVHQENENERESFPQKSVEQAVWSGQSPAWKERNCPQEANCTTLKES